MRRSHGRARRAAQEAHSGTVDVSRGAAPPPVIALAAMLIVMTAGVLAYSNTFSAPFFFDDLGSIPENPHIRQLWPLSRALTAPPQEAVAGRPVVSLSLAINYAIGELNVRGYHAFNLIVHLLCGLLLFGVHPLTVEPVA